MAKEIITTCDIKGCNNRDNVNSRKMQVIFTTEQTEGRPVSPYLQEETIDLCDKCLSKIIENTKYITASGAMGYNDYCI